MSSHEAADQHSHHHQPPHHLHLVEITIDGTKRDIPRGCYLVADLKKELGVPADYELDIVQQGQFKALVDTHDIDVVGHEHFVSHVRRGGSS